MGIIIVASAAENTGKTMLCAGLGRYWLEQGRQPGYLRPVFSNAGIVPDNFKQDAAFMQKSLGLSGTVDLLCPFISPGSQPGQAMKKTVCENLENRDCLLIECLISDILEDLPADLNAKLIIVHDYVNSLLDSIPQYTGMTDRLAGLIINKVPLKDLKRTADQVIPLLNSAGIKLLGLIPEDRILLAPEIADLNSAVQGKIINNAGNPSDLIENLMVGSSTFDRGSAYYSRKSNKAVILWGERPGFRKAALANYQLAALQTSTRCIIISSGGLPIPNVGQKADEAKATIISAPGSIPEITGAIEKAMVALKFHQENKLPRLLEILKSRLDLKSIDLA